MARPASLESEGPEHNAFSVTTRVSNRNPRSELILNSDIRRNLVRITVVVEQFEPIANLRFDECGMANLEVT
jgi:hypothetical protein